MYWARRRSHRRTWPYTTCPLTTITVLPRPYPSVVSTSLYVLEVRTFHSGPPSAVVFFSGSACRFGFHNASTIDSLLNKEDVSLESILDQDDLLQECKAQNTRLIDYFQRVDVLQRLFGYVTGQIEGDEGGRFKCVDILLSGISNNLNSTL